jgi:hypothetical protein
MCLGLGLGYIRFRIGLGVRCVIRLAISVIFGSNFALPTSGFPVVVATILPIFAPHCALLLSLRLTEEMDTGPSLTVGGILGIESALDEP